MANQTTKKRTQTLYHVKEDPKGERKSIWTRVGIAFENTDGKGWSLLFDVPLALAEGSRLTMREPLPKEAAAGDGE